jgi:hypothetical protein
MLAGVVVDREHLGELVVSAVEVLAPAAAPKLLGPEERMFLAAHGDVDGVHLTRADQDAIGAGASHGCTSMLKAETLRDRCSRRIVR